MRGLDPRAPGVSLRQRFRPQGVGVPEVRGPLRERPAVGYVTSAWGWSGSLGTGGSSLGWGRF